MKGCRTGLEKIEARARLCTVSLSNAADDYGIASHLGRAGTQTMEHDGSPLFVEPVGLFHFE